MRISKTAAAIGGSYTKDGEFSGFCIDSRKIKPGDIFVCFKGERVDGHDFAQEAAQKGAAGLLCERELDCALPQIIVKSSITGLQCIAALHRGHFNNLILVAVTGSVGKTTTKEFIGAVLATQHTTHKTQGNMNSETGLPLTLLGLRQTHSAAVVEMGMSNLGEISLLSRLAKPTMAVITNVGVSHIEYLGSRENIFKAKSEIIDGLLPDGPLFINGDDEFLPRLKTSRKNTYTFGLGEKNDIYAYDILSYPSGLKFMAATPAGSFLFEIPFDGIHNIYNALAAAAVGVYCNISLQNIAAGLKNIENPPLRQNIYEKNGYTIIEDCYNAVPDSMSAAIKVLLSKNGRKIALLGDMLELGKFSEEFHEKVGAKLAGTEVLICYGKFADCYIKGAKKAGVPFCFKCDDTAQAAEKLKQTAKEGDVILFKASRGMYAERVIEAFFKV